MMPNVPERKVLLSTVGQLKVSPGLPGLRFEINRNKERLSVGFVPALNSAQLETPSASGSASAFDNGFETELK